MEPNATTDIGIPINDMNQWRILFNYTYKETLEEISHQRMFPAEKGIPDMVWDMVESGLGTEAMDRRTFEYRVKKNRVQFVRIANERAAGLSFPSRGAYYVQVKEPLETVEKIQLFARLSQRPSVVKWYTKNGEQCKFCLLIGEQFLTLYSLASACYPNHKIRYLKEWPACKHLPNSLISPVLGESFPEFMPQLAFPMQFPSPNSQHRPGDTWPLQNEYPVWYFLYGSLLGEEWLNDIFKFQEDEQMNTFAAKTVGGRIDYRDEDMVLVDAPPHHMVNGVACLVETKVLEDALCAYTTSQFDVVRCYILLFGGEVPEMVKGCTFRLAPR